MRTEIVSRFASCERASVATIFAFSLLMLLAACGIAIDYSSAHDRRAKFDSAADSAVLAAVKAARDSFVSGDAGWEAAAQMAGEAIFRQNSRMILGGGGNLKTVAVTVQRNGNEFVGRLTYDASYPTSIMKLFHKNEIGISNTALANFAIASYLDVHLLIDASPSMGIGATLADQLTMMNDPAVNCALACHQQAGHLEAVRATGARTRIDIVRDAVRKFIDDLKLERVSMDQVRISIHLFSNDIHEIFASSTDLDAAYAAAANIELLGYPAFGSNSAYAISRLNSAIPAGGQGFLDTDRKSYVVLLSDGIEDSRYQPDPAVAETLDPNFLNTAPYYIASFGTERLQTIEAASCAPIKANKHNMMTAHVEYLVPPAAAGATDRFDFIRDNLIDKSIAEYEACASSPSMAYKASESIDIEPMFGQILNEIMAPSDLRLTN